LKCRHFKSHTSYNFGPFRAKHETFDTCFETSFRHEDSDERFNYNKYDSEVQKEDIEVRDVAFNIQLEAGISDEHVLFDYLYFPGLIQPNPVAEVSQRVRTWKVSLVIL